MAALPRANLEPHLVRLIASLRVPHVKEAVALLLDYIDANQSSPATDAALIALLPAARKVVAMTFTEGRAAADRGKRLLYCQCDAFNPCWDNRPDDVPGQHWGGGEACAECNLRAAIAKATGTTP